MRRIADQATLLVSDALLEELASVLARPKFDRYVSAEERQEFVRLLVRVAEPVPILRRIRACRDPKDDLLLEIAINGQASVILTEDRDLLALHPFEGIPILRPGTWLGSSA